MSYDEIKYAAFTDELEKTAWNLKSITAGGSAIGGALGAGIGAYRGGEGNRLKGALIGGVGGAALGGGAAHIGGRLGIRSSAVTASAAKASAAKAKKVIPSSASKASNVISSAPPVAQTTAQRLGVTGGAVNHTGFASGRGLSQHAAVPMTRPPVSAKAVKAAKNKARMDSMREGIQNAKSKGSQQVAQGGAVNHTGFASGTPLSQNKAVPLTSSPAKAAVTSAAPTAQDVSTAKNKARMASMREGVQDAKIRGQQHAAQTNTRRAQHVEKVKKRAERKIKSQNARPGDVNMLGTPADGSRAYVPTKHLDIHRAAQYPYKGMPLKSRAASGSTAGW